MTSSTFRETIHLFIQLLSDNKHVVESYFSRSEMSRRPGGIKNNAEILAKVLTLSTLNDIDLEAVLCFAQTLSAFSRIETVSDADRTGFELLIANIDSLLTCWNRQANLCLKILHQENIAVGEELASWIEDFLASVLKDSPHSTIGNQLSSKSSDAKMKSQDKEKSTKRVCEPGEPAERAKKAKNAKIAVTDKTKTHCTLAEKFGVLANRLPTPFELGILEEEFEIPNESSESVSTFKLSNLVHEIYNHTINNAPKN